MLPKKRGEDSSLINLRLIFDVESPDLRIKVFKLKELANCFILFLGATLANNTSRNLLELEKKNGKIREKY